MGVKSESSSIGIFRQPSEDLRRGRISTGPSESFGSTKMMMRGHHNNPVSDQVLQNTDINGGTKMSLVLMMRSDHGIVAASDSRTSFQQYENYGIRNDQSKKIFKTDLCAWEQTT